MTLTLAEIAAFTGAVPPAASLPISGWSIDTRTLSPGDLYIALRGENHDGHAFLAAAAARGAAAAIVEDRDWPQAGPLPLLRVPATLPALQQLARQARARLTFPLIAVTGSAGKTSTKDMIAAIAGASRRVTSNSGNFNNHIGLPLSLLRMDETAQAGVLEMGMNHSGEIRFLCSIARPDIGVVTNVGSAHIENFRSIDGIALAKRELIEELGPQGVAVLNHDDPRVRAFARVHPGRTLTYGLTEGADFRAEDVEFTAEGARFRIGAVPFSVALNGRHGVLNVTAAVAAGSVLGLRLPEMANAARALRAGKMRGERIEHRGISLWNDCYNSNPEAAMAMLDLLAATPAQRRIAVLGEMLELGAASADLHNKVGAYAAAAGIDVVIGIRGAARQLADAAAEGGAEALFFDEPAAAGEAVISLARPGDSVLWKGSRGTRVELALERFMAG